MLSLYGRNGYQSLARGFRQAERAVRTAKKYWDYGQRAGKQLKRVYGVGDNGPSGPFQSGRLPKRRKPNPKKKVSKSHGGDHPIQELGAIDGDNLRITVHKGKKPKNIGKGIIRQYATYQGIIGNGVPNAKQGTEIMLYSAIRRHFTTVDTTFGADTNSGAAAYGPLDLPQKLFNLLPGNPVTTNGLTNNFFNGRTDTKYNYDQLFLRRVQHKIDLLNPTNGPQIIDLYFCKPKRQGSTTPLDCWNYTTEPAYSALQVYNTGVPGGAINATTNQLDRFNYGCTPKSSQLFKDNWNIVTVKSYMLAPGAYQKLNVDLVYNKLYKKSVLANNQPMDFIPGSITIMGVVRGGLGVWTTETGVPETNTGSTQDTTSLTWMKPRVCWASQTIYSFSAVVETARSLQNYNIATNIMKVDPAYVKAVDVSDITEDINSKSIV